MIVTYHNLAVALCAVLAYIAFVGGYSITSTLLAALLVPWHVLAAWTTELYTAYHSMKGAEEVYHRSTSEP